MAKSSGGKNEFKTEMTEGTGIAEYRNAVGVLYLAIAGVKHTVYAWRENKYNDPILHIKVYSDACKLEFGNNAPVGWDMNAKSTVQMTALYTPGSPQGPYYSSVRSSGNVDNNNTFGVNTGSSSLASHWWYIYSPGIWNSDEYKVTCYDKYPDIKITDQPLITKVGAMFDVRAYILSGNGSSASSNASSSNGHNMRNYLYPPYIPVPSWNDGNKDFSNNGSSTSDGKDIGDDSGNINLTISKTYSITRASDTTQKVSWSPNGTTGSHGLTITNVCTVEYIGTSSSSPYSFTTPNVIGSSYTAWVKRYYTDMTDIQARSKTITLYTYQKPTLNSISLNKYNISPRNGESLTLSLDCNNRKWTIENNFRTGIWSNYKPKYYIDYETTDKSRVLSLAEIKVLSPDSKAVNGITTATISVNRRNLGVSGGNPGKDSLVYETGTKTKEIKVYYKPQVALNPSDGSISYYKVEKGTRGAQINAKTTWVLPNTYNINDMTGIDVRLIYPKTDTSGVINGYKVELLLPNDGTHGTDYVWNTLYFYTEDYDYYARIPYDKLKRGISGNRIRITPFYVPNGVSQGSTGNYWYGPSTTKDFVDISWMLRDPVIDCPLNNTTWHNHQYRILFKLPIDNDTNYKGINDIEVHYGSGKYRYQEIEISVNGNRTLLGNNVYMNAQNNWASVTNVNNAKLTYLREIIINPVLLPNYRNESSYRIMIRVRKAYGQNSNFDGWSNWSSAVVVNTKTVSNTNVQKDEYIMASHYMNVQNAFNNSLSCYSKKSSDNSAFVIQESFDRSRGHNINGPHLSPPTNTPLQTVKEYVSEFNDLHQLKNKINSYAKFDTDKNRNSVKLDYQNKLLASFTPLQEFITAAKDQNGATENIGNPPNLKGRNYMKYMCDEINNLK